VKGENRHENTQTLLTEGVDSNVVSLGSAKFVNLIHDMTQQEQRL
jgi:hypothetical protein